MSQWRLACVVLVDFAVSACGHDREVDRCAVVVDKTGHHILAVNQTAAKHGVMIGDPIGGAWSRCSNLNVLEWSDQKIEHATQGVLKCLETLTPRCQSIPGYVGCFMLDAGGMSLLGGENALIQRVRCACVALGYADVRLGVGDQWGIAFLAARSTGLNAPIRVVNQADKAEFIEHVSLSDLEYDAIADKGLKLLGIEKLGQLKAFSRAALRERFGHTLDHLFSLIDALDFRVPRDYSATDLPQVQWALEQPVKVVSHLLLGVRHLCISLSVQLMNLACQTNLLSLECLLDNGEQHVEMLTLSSAISTADSLFEVVRTRIESQRMHDLNSPVVHIDIKTLAVVPLEGEQIVLTTGKWQQHKAQAVLNRLVAHANQPVVYRAIQTPEPVRDDMFCWSPLSKLNDSLPSMSDTASQPTLIRRRLAEPFEIRVKLDTHHEVKAIRLDHRWHRVNVVSKERYSGGWWCERPYAYEDLCLENAQYGLCWVRHLTLNESWVLMGGWD